MRNFLMGFLVAAITVPLVAFACIRFGMMDSRADIPVSALEQRMAMPSLDASLERRAPQAKNPTDLTDSNLVAGMNIYQSNCASCHGDIHHPHGSLADALYPRAPQFLEDAPDMAENQNFYIIQHGIRMSGMPAWKRALSEQQMWQVTTFLSQMDKLPPQVSDQWKLAAGGASAAPPSSHPSTMDKEMDKKMDMK